MLFAIAITLSPYIFRCCLIDFAAAISPFSLFAACRRRRYFSMLRFLLSMLLMLLMPLIAFSPCYYCSDTALATFAAVYHEDTLP